MLAGERCPEPLRLHQCACPADVADVFTGAAYRMSLYICLESRVSLLAGDRLEVGDTGGVGGSYLMPGSEIGQVSCETGGERHEAH